MPRYIDADKFLARNAVYADREFDHPKYQETLREIVDKEPTLSPDDVRGAGEWIEKEVYNLEDTTIEQMQSARCSSCGKYHTTPFSYYFSKYNYCPNCGAKMEVSEDA